MDDRITIVFIEVNQKPRLIDMPNTIEAMQSLVGGYIEFIDFSKGLNDLGVNVIVDEDGMSNNKLPSVIMLEEGREVLLYGNVVLSGNKNGDFASLSNEQILRLSNDMLRYGDIEVEVKRSENGESLGVIDLTTIII